MPENLSLSPGDTLSHYEIVDKIGEGGMGAVYRAVDRTLGRTVALKTISTGHAGGDAQQRLIREARAASALNHPNIITIHEFGSHDGLTFIVMEFVEGDTLGQVLRTRTFAVDEVIRCARQMASALRRAHEAGVIHRDLKPGNIMLTDNGTIKLLDFGLAKHHISDSGGPADHTQSLSLTQPGSLMGTPAYMAPEQAIGAEVSSRSDIFSFGVILYEMACGQRPFQGVDPPSVLLQIVRKDPPPIEKLRPELPTALVSLIADCLKKDQEDRPASMAEVEQRLAFLSHPTLSSPAAETLTSIQKPVRRELKVPKAAWVGIAAVALAGALTFPRSREWMESRARSAVELTSAGWTERGRQYLHRFDEKGNTDRAVDAFTKAIEKDGENPRAYAGLAEAYVRKSTETPDSQWISRAVAAAQKAVQLNDLLATSHIAMGAALVQSGKPKDAVASLQRALQLEPRSSEARRALAAAHIRLNDNATAEKLYRDAMALAPGDWRGTNDLVLLLNRMGRNGEALEMLEKLNREFPSNSMILMNLSVAYHALGRYEESATAIQRSVELSPTPRGFSNLGTLLFFMGRYESAVDAFEKALKIDANAYRTWGNLADAYRWAPGKRKQAGEAYLRATQLLEPALLRNPKDAPTLSTAATYHAKRGDIAAARALLGRIDLTKETGSVVFKAAVVEELAGDRVRALDLLSQALERGYPQAEVAADPELLALRSDPRYHQLLARAATSHK